MKFVYIDETGTGEEPISVMAGVVADAYRMRPTKAHWNELLQELSEIIGRPIQEIHTRDFYSGNSPWRELQGQQRAEIITAIFDWLRDRKHSIVYTAVNKHTFFQNFQNEDYSQDIATLWRFMAIHITLSLQKCYQGAPRRRNRTLYNRGACVLIFDNEHREESRFTNLIIDPPDWTDSYYDRRPNQAKFSQIIDVPHFVDSRQVGLIQLADFICFFIRKHLELTMELVEPAYPDEVERVHHWYEQIMGQAIERRNIYMKRNRCDCADLFYRYAPESIV